MTMEVSNHVLVTPTDLGFGWVVKRGGETYTAMSTVGATALLGCLVDLDVLDDQVAGVEAFGVGV